MNADVLSSLFVAKNLALWVAHVAAKFVIMYISRCMTADVLGHSYRRKAALWFTSLNRIIFQPVVWLLVRRLVLTGVFPELVSTRPVLAPVLAQYLFQDLLPFSLEISMKPQCGNTKSSKDP